MNHPDPRNPSTGPRRTRLLIAFGVLAIAQLLTLGALVLRPSPLPAAPVAVTQAEPARAGGAAEEGGALPTIYPGT